MTTSSGKPPFNEQSRDSSWDAGSDDNPAGGPDSSGEPPTQRQPSVGPAGPAVPLASPDAPDTEAESEPVYGVGVPYGGNDRTEEIEPIALDMPFTREDRKTPPAPVALPATSVDTPRAPVAAPQRGFDMASPVKQLMLSDLFDSTPSSGAMAPPDPAAFSSSRPPPQERPRPERSAPERPATERLPPDRVPTERFHQERAVRERSIQERAALEQQPPRARNALVALRSIDVGGSPAAARPEPEAQRGLPALESVGQSGSPPMQPQPAAVRAPTPVSSPAATEPLTPPAPVASASSPVAASSPHAASTTAPAAASSAPFASSSPLVAPSASSSAPSASVPSASSSSSPAHASPRVASPMPPPVASPPAVDATPGASSPSAVASEPALDPVPRFPSEVPTSRPPDVVPSHVATSRPPDVVLGAPPHVGASPPAAARAPFESRPPRGAWSAPATVTAPAPVQSAQASGLPSIILAADVEAEPDPSARRAMRAARATVRLELPPNFGRPGSPVSPGSASAPPPGAPPVMSYVPSMPSAPSPQLAAEARPSFLANPQTKRLVGAALVGLVLLVALLFALGPRTGSLVVTALAPGNRAVDDVTIFIDGKPLCDVSPCRIKGLSPGVHSLRASAPNLASQAEETVEISAGEEATYNIDLLAVAHEVRGGGIRVAAGEAPLTLFVDGKRVGKLPQEVSGLAAGKHWIKLDPEDGTPAFEKSVNVLAGETVDVEPRPAKRDKALVTIRLSRGSEGALVTFDDAFLLDFPAELELEPNTTHTLSATKPGYEDLSMDVTLAAGETEKLIEVALSPAEGSSPARKSRPKVAKKSAAKASTTAATALADSTQGLLNISSVPPSQIILNGRPLGSTPKTGITVPGDSLQTIVFVHPKMGRRRAQKFVPAGKERTVSIRF